MLKRALSLLLVLCSLLALVPAGVVSAATVEQPVTQQGNTGVAYHVNPFHPELEERFATQQARTYTSVAMPTTEAEYVSEKKAAAVVRKAAEKRESEVEVSFYVDEIYSSPRDHLFDLLDVAFQHTGVPTQGDYLQWQYGGCWASYYYDFDYDKGRTLYSIRYYDIIYYTSAAQEEKMDKAVKELLDELDLYENTDYQKVKGIYDYMTYNIRYDYANLNDDSYDLKYTAYAGLVNGTCVCQGYANLFYRLALELGVDARLVAGYGGGPHSWNIVCLDGVYYYLDATWDEGSWYDGEPYYNWFLLSPDNFANHEPWAYEFAKYKFPETYPMATSNYEYDPLHSNLEIVEQPKDAVGAVGTKVKATIKAAGEGVKYQWYIKNPGATKFSKSSVTGATYSVKLTKENLGRKAYCIVTDVYGNELKSDTITFKKGEALKITQQPRSATAAKGTTVKITVKAEGDGLTYKWYYADKGETKYKVSTTCKTATYKIEMTAARNGRRVYCVITDRNGNSVKSNVAKMTLGNTLKITTQPKTTYAKDGAAIKITVKAAGDDLKYQWYFKDSDAKTFSKSSNTSATYKTTMSSTTRGRQVYCVITDKHGSSVQTNTVHLRMSVTIKTQPKDAWAKSGETAKTTVKATGSGLKYQWYYCDPGSSKFKKSTKTSATYSCTMNAENNGREVYCVITDTYGKRVKTATVTLHMGTELKITQQPKNVSGAKGSVVKITVKAQGDGLRYKWYYADKGETKFKVSSTCKGSTYKQEMTAARNGRRVYCVITDKYGNTVKSNVAKMTIGSTLKITTQPKTSYAQSGKTVSVTVKASGEGLKYQWYIKNAGSDSYSKSSITSATYKATMSSSVHGRRVYCVVTDKHGNKVTSETAVLRMSVSIKTQPKDVEVKSGAKASVSVKAIGYGLKYQWYVCDPGSTSFKKSSITSATYSCTMKAAIDGREVYCVVTDQYGKTVKTKTVVLSMK